MFNLVGKSLGRYHVVEPLGEGGMASVFKAFDKTLERYVAVKVIRTDKGQDESFLHRFQREAKALARLDHPYILKVLDYGEQDGMPYLVMPFVPGGTLKNRMGQPIQAAEAAALLAPVARALEYAHRQNIIHRDIKPANILITQSGEPVLSDFGIAKILDQADQSTQLTGTGVGIGTPDYMAPEQWMGQADPRTDVYALGVVFYEMVTGRRPYSADTPAAVLIKHIQDPLPSPRLLAPALSDEAEGILFKALAKKPEERYQEIGSLAAALERLAQRKQDASVPVFPSQEDATIDTGGITPLPPTVHAPALSVPTGTVVAPVQPSTVSGRTAVQPRALPSKFILTGIATVVVLAVTALGAVLLSQGKLPPAVSNPSPGATPSVTIVAGAAESAPTNTAAGPAVAAPTNTPAVPPTPAPTATRAPVTEIEGLPPDVPLLADNNGDLITTTNPGVQVFTFTSSLDFDAIVQFYRDGMAGQGWTLGNTTEQKGEMLMLTYIKGDGERAVMITLSAQPETTYISLMITQPE